MAKLWELLDEVYNLINKNRYQEAQVILDQILKLDPQNVEAWDAYIRSCATRGDLEGLRSYISTVWETRVRDRDYLQAKQRFVLQRLDEKLNAL
ncbi:MAG: tetratricopeptide repeat protein [Anaerolineales bacterium]|nr:tetratricopeptide repeat protein [Anaerolineales bacterium]